MQVIKTKNYTLAQNTVETPEEPIAPQKNVGLGEMALWTLNKHTGKLPEKDEVWPLGKGRNMHGYFCGPGPVRDSTCQKLADNSPLPAPQDKLDCACMEHDLDYCKLGIGWRQAYGTFISPEASVADKKFINNIDKLIKTNQLNWYQTLKAKMVMNFFGFRQRLPKTDRDGRKLSPQEWKARIPKFAHQSQRHPYDENVKPCTSCSRAASKRLSESS